MCLGGIMASPKEVLKKGLKRGDKTPDKGAVAQQTKQAAIAQSRPTVQPPLNNPMEEAMQQEQNAKGGRTFPGMPV